MNILDRVKKVIELIQSETDIEEIDFGNKETGTHIRVKRNLTNQCIRSDEACPEYHRFAAKEGFSECPYCNQKLSGG